MVVSREKISIPDVDAAKQKLSPDEYVKELRTAQLFDLRLSSLEARSVSEGPGSIGPDMRLKITRTGHLGFNDDTYSSFINEYTVEGLRGKKVAIRIKAAFEVGLRSDNKLSKEFLIIYSRNSGDMQIWPYLRELCQEMTSRMGLTVLVLPLLTDPSHLDVPAKALPEA
jgi:hypothetical protein